jgi:hypothetical protein
MTMPQSVAVLAEASNSSQFLTKLAEFSPAGLTRLGMLAAGLAMGVLVAWCLSRWQARRKQRDPSPHNPYRLFGELCQAHGLTAAQRRLLEWLAADRELLQPAMAFLDPILLESAIAHAESAGVRKRLVELRSKLFAAGEANDSASPASR